MTAMSLHADPASDVEAETQRQKTALLYRISGIAQSVNIVNATLLAYVVVSLQSSARVAFVWWCFAVAIAAGRYLLARRFLAARPDASAAMKWRHRHIGATAMMAATWGAGTVLFMWNAPDSALLFTGAVLTGMVAGAVPLLAPVPAAFATYAVLVAVPMSAVILLQAHSPLQWAFGAMSLIFLAAMIASVRYLHQTLDVAIRLGLEQGRLVENLEQARSAAEAALSERKRLEEEMRRERDFAESLIDTARAIVLVLDTEGRIVRFNRYLEEISGYRQEEVKGASWFAKFLRHGDQAAVQTLFKQALTDFRMQANINAIVAKDGRQIQVEWSGTALKDSDGNVVGLLAIGQDVTQREKLTESQRLLMAAVEQSNSSIMVTDYDTRIVFVNAGFTQTTGYSIEEAIGRNPSILKSGQTPPETYRELWATLAGRRAWQGELVNRKKNGDLYWEAANISPIVDSHGRITHYLAVKEDITRRKQAETALQEQKNFLAAILENEPECVTVMDADGTLLQMNKAGLAMLEVNSVEEANAIGMLRFVVPEHRAAFLDVARRVMGGETGGLEFRIQGKQGTRRWLEGQSAPLRDAAGKVTYLLGVTRDVTDKRLAEERLALSLRGSDLALTDWRIPGDVLVLGEGWTKLLGYQTDELPAHAPALAGLIRPEDVPVADKVLIRHLKGETPFFEAEVRMRHKDGRWIWVLARGMAVERSADGRAVRVAGTAMDITGRKQAEAEIARLSEWNELLLNSAGQGIYGTDLDGVCTFINPAALAILGFEKQEVLGKNTHRMFHHHHKDGAPYPEEDCPVDLTRRDGIRREIEETFIRKNGEVFPVQLSITPMHEDDQLVGVAAVFEDIAGRKAMEQELTRLATTDPLTGVANRRRFIEQLEIELARMQRFDKPAAFLMMDVDNFKNVNDTYGHAVGDAVLRHLAELSQHRLRRIDLFGRLGGEEFGILLPGTDAAGARQFADSFRRYVADTPLESSKGIIPLTVSIGVAEFDPGDAAPDGVLARADTALYRAKEGGRNRVEVA
jgi:diguanylate cyclase (GGDEF)-like protein/PAS domain S-box-containing protein